MASSGNLSGRGTCPTLEMKEMSEYALGPLAEELFGKVAAGNPLRDLREGRIDMDAPSHH
jgi:hypothetical protein